MKKSPSFNLVIIPVVALLLITGCKKNSSSSVPLITTTQVSSIDSTTAIGGGDIFSDGGDLVTARGVCWSSGTPLPTISDNKTSDGQGTSSFSSSLTGLTKGTLYYVRAYATNIVGTAYGQAVSFTTLSPNNSNPPPVTSQAITLDATNIAAITATLNGSVPSGSSISDVSFDYGLTNTYGSNMPAVLGPSSSGTLLVTADISGLLAYTVYHFRVVLNTTGGVIYGDDKIFMTTY